MDCLLIILLAQIPEAIYFSLFIIFTKELKSKRIIFTYLMIIEYLLLIFIFPFNIWFQIFYTFISYVLLRILYKDNAQITDIFTFGISSIILIIISAITSLLFQPDIILALIVSRFIMFLFLIVFKHKLNKLQKIYSKLWNRNNKPKKIKSTTFRAINIVIFNFMFYIINIGMLYALLFVK